MEYAKDEMFQISYHTKLNRLERGKESRASRVWREITKHKLLTTTIFAFFMFAAFNMVMIYHFIRILQNI